MGHLNRPEEAKTTRDERETALWLEARYLDKLLELMKTVAHVVNEKHASRLYLHQLKQKSIIDPTQNDEATQCIATVKTALQTALDAFFAATNSPPEEKPQFALFLVDRLARHVADESSGIRKWIEEHLGVLKKSEAHKANAERLEKAARKSASASAQKIRVLNKHADWFHVAEVSEHLRAENTMAKLTVTLKLPAVAEAKSTSSSGPSNAQQQTSDGGSEHHHTLIVEIPLLSAH